MSKSEFHAIRKYFKRMFEIRGTGGATDETSYYSALENLLNELGKQLKPSVVCNSQLRSSGAGHPDFGLYSKSQCLKDEPKPGQKPERGVVEVKPLSENMEKTIQSAQTTKYLNKYHLVLVTNYREFRLIGRDDSGKPEVRETYSLADSEEGFWALAENSIKTSKLKGANFTEFVHRVMMNFVSLEEPKDVAWFLASYARDALGTLENQKASVLAPLREALETALGIKFEDDKGEHFFRSTLIQTLFYGVFSAWVVWKKKGKSGAFDWRTSSHHFTVPMVRSLFQMIFASSSKLGPLELENVLDQTGETLNRITSKKFFKTFDTGQAVQHFYEPFLEAFDPVLRKQMGVWYTPPEIVKYMVSRVDTVLKTELGIKDGLANKDVYVLDPCCGTGTFIIEVLRKIEETLKAKGDDPLIGDDIKDAACKRIFGFEIMSAPFVVAHWQVENMLAELGVGQETSKSERPAIYLTNALTGWQSSGGAEIPFFVELAQEIDQAEKIKCKKPILVVLGNPPYNAYAGTSPKEEEGLVEPYKEGLISNWKITKFNLDDLYIRFFRIAERRITNTGKGVVAYISNYSYAREQSFVVMRQHLLQSFDKFWIDDMHGDQYRAETPPDGKVSQSIFKVANYSSGIKQGVVISLAVKNGSNDSMATVRYRGDINKAKAEDRRQQLLDAIDDPKIDSHYQVTQPKNWNKFLFYPSDVNQEYLEWPEIADLCIVQPFKGLLEMRRGALIGMDKLKLEERTKPYFDSSIDWDSFKSLGSTLANDSATYIAKEVRDKVLDDKHTFNPNNIVRYHFRPFDVRYAYYTDISKVWHRPRPEFWAQHSISDNRFLVTRRMGVANPEGAPITFTRCLGDYHAYLKNASYIPFISRSKRGIVGPNVSPAAEKYLTSLGFTSSKDSSTGLWHHVLAIGYSPLYLSENKDGIKIDWPRIPLPIDASDFNNSTELGSQVATFLDTENEPVGGTAEFIFNHFKKIGNFASKDLELNANWGHKSSVGKVTPAKGNWEEREWDSDEKIELSVCFTKLGISEDRGFELLGGAVDAYLNDTNCWRGIPKAVWDYYIGGYPVIRKWLSYRESKIIGRRLTKEEAREVRDKVRRITGLILLSDKLDENYKKVCDNTYAWATTSKHETEPTTKEMEL